MGALIVSKRASGSLNGSAILKLSPEMLTVAPAAKEPNLRVSPISPFVVL